MLCTNKQGHLVKLWCHARDDGVKTNFKLEASNLLVGNNSKVKSVITHPQLPVVALILDKPTETDFNEI